MMNKQTKGLLLITTFLQPIYTFVGNNISFAGESKDEYVFDPIIVTAQRCSKTDMDTPAAVTVYSAEQLKLTGANSVIEALKYSEGIIYHAQGPLGNSQGAMTSKLIIRGVEKGTLVLIDGVPLNLHGRYNLEDISLNDIEKIENKYYIYFSSRFGNPDDFNALPGILILNDDF